MMNPLQLARNGEEAIDYISGAGKYANRQEYPIPGLVLLDLKLPRVSGLEVLQWLRRSPVSRCLPVIVFSSSARRQDVEEAYAQGANSFLVKPSSLDKRIELARLIKAYWLEFNEPMVEIGKVMEERRRWTSLTLTASAPHARCGGTYRYRRQLSGRAG